MLKLPIVVAAFAFLLAGASAQVSSIPEEVRKELCAYFEREGPKPGQQAPDFTLEDVGGGKVHAAELWAKKPTVVISGSYSCPFFRRNAGPLKALARDFGARVNFLFLYTLEVHPSDAPSPYSAIPFTPVENQNEGIAIPQAGTFPARLATARRCRDALGLTSTVAVDTMDNATWKAYGGSMNCAYLIGTDGKVLVKQGLCDPAALRAALEKLPAR